MGPKSSNFYVRIFHEINHLCIVMWCVLFIEISMKYNFPISILFFCPLRKLSYGHRWVAASARPFTMRVCVPAAGEPRACFPNLGNLGNFWELQSPSRSTSHLMQKDPKDPKDSKSTSESQDVSRGILSTKWS